MHGSRTSSRPRRLHAKELAGVHQERVNSKLRQGESHLSWAIYVHTDVMIALDLEA